MSGPNDWIRKKNSAQKLIRSAIADHPSLSSSSPGQSGNPRGRKKGVKNVATIFNQALYRPVKIRTPGGVRTLPKIEAIVEVIMNKALAGDTAAVSRIVELAHKLGGFEFLANSTNTSPNRESAYERLSRLFAAECPAQSDAPNSSNGTPEPNSDQKKAKE